MTRAMEIHAQKFPLPHACGLYNSRALSALGYVARLAPPPESFKIAELSMANKILRLATNSFNSDAAHQLELLHGPRLPRPLAYVIACMTRASLKTLNGFESQHKQLVESVCSHVSLVAADLSDPVPDGWDSVAFCSNLLKASNGDMAETYFPGSKTLILQIRRSFERKRLKGGLQKAIYNALLSTIPPAFETVFAR